MTTVVVAVAFTVVLTLSRLIVAGGGDVTET
jgi:hypothetical protein